MKPRSALLSMMILAVFAAGCGSSSSDSTKEPEAITSSDNQSSDNGSTGPKSDVDAQVEKQIQVREQISDLESRPGNPVRSSRCVPNSDPDQPAAKFECLVEFKYGSDELCRTDTPDSAGRVNAYFCESLGSVGWYEDCLSKTSKETCESIASRQYRKCLHGDSSLANMCRRTIFGRNQE